MAENGGFAEGLAVGMTNGNNGCYMPMYPMGYGGGGGFGNEWNGIIGLIAVASIFGGNGGLFGGNRGGVGENYVLATDFATIERKIDGVNQGLCDGFYAMNTGMLNGFAGVQQTLCQGFNGVNQSITDVGYAIKDCCCQTQRAIDSVRFENAKNTCDIIRSGQDNTRAILDYLTGEKIESLRAENTDLKGQISNYRQSTYITDTILDRLSPYPKPAYLTCNPNAPYGLGYGVGYGFSTNNGGCCGASVQ